MKRFIRVAISAGLMANAPGVFAKAAYLGAEQMVTGSVAIAVVNISRVDPVETKGAHWTYGERAEATVERTPKGSLPQQVQLFGNENFICAQVRFQPGRYLVFLKKDGEKLVGANWHLSARLIKDDKIEWYSGKGHLELSWQSLPKVIDQVNALSKPAK
jgi:hypothetical protein